MVVVHGTCSSPENFFGADLQHDFESVYFECKIVLFYMILEKSQFPSACDGSARHLFFPLKISLARIFISTLIAPSLGASKPTLKQQRDYPVRAQVKPTLKTLVSL